MTESPRPAGLSRLPGAGTVEPGALDQFPGRRAAAGGLVRGTGCARCRQTGYLGRTGIYEILPLDAETRAWLARGGGGSRFHEAVRRRRRPTLFDDGVRKVAAGLPTLEEVMRVASPSANGEVH